MATTNELPYDQRQPYYDLLKNHKKEEAKQYHGVSFHARKGKFEGKIKSGGKTRAKTFNSAREAAIGVDSYSYHVEEQKYPMNFPDEIPPVIDWPVMNHRKAGGLGAARKKAEFKEQKLSQELESGVGKKKRGRKVKKKVSRVKKEIKGKVVTKKEINKIAKKKKKKVPIVKKKKKIPIVKEEEESESEEVEEERKKTKRRIKKKVAIKRKRGEEK